MARPKIQINWKDFRKLCGLQCTLEEIASWFECSEDTIERAVKRQYHMSFADFHKRHSENGKTSLRRLQWMSAQKGNVTMQIWLGKQYLGQKEKVEHGGDGERPVLFRIIDAGTPAPADDNGQ